MANVLKMAIIESIRSLYAQGWSQRRIARELGIDRGTVRKYLSSGFFGADSAPTPSAFDESKPATFSPLPAPTPKPATNLPTGSVAGFEAGQPADRGTAPADQLPNADGAAAVTHKPPGPSSDCEPYRDRIVEQVQAGLTAQRIYQDLVADQIKIGYDSVRRFVQRLRHDRPLPFRRMECGPGEEAQVDFGTGAPVVTADGKRRRTYVFRIVLSHSRKAYSEATFTQTTEDFFRALENAFAHFGGVPLTLVIDNLKAAVAHPDWFDPILTPKVQSFCHHYGTTILPTRPYMPRHKGKVESGVKYVKNNALKKRVFATLDEQNQFLQHWEASVADTRIHGTTKQQVGKLFQAERPALRPLPIERFACFHEAQRKVSRDGHVAVAKAYYSVPPEHLGRTVWVRWDARLVRIFNARFEQIAIHTRREPGRFSTLPEHLAKEKISGLERGAEYLLRKVASLGTHAQQWSEAMLVARGIQGTRVLQGLLSLSSKHSSQALERACETAQSYGCYRLQTIRKLAERQADQQGSFEFLDEHPIIRPLDDYAQIVARALQRQTDRSSMSEGLGRHDRTETAAGLKSLPAPASVPAGYADLSPPRPGYPSSSCASAEPDSVSPDKFDCSS